MATKLMPTDQIVDVLSHSPQRIATAIDGIADDLLASHPEPEEWSPLQVLIHLRACADVWGDSRIVRMLDEDEPTIRAVNPMTWLAETEYRTVPFRSSLSAFTAQRQSLLRRLVALQPGDWERGATFTGGGKPRRYTVWTEADALARHERAHLKQIDRRCELL
ncbi:MAG: DinB family protein [Thermomicrobiales bacterium]|nr:DinB family protein [Thermomicrobiales bacterium]